MSCLILDGIETDATSLTPLYYTDLISFAYALAVATSGKAGQILMAGFDGYQQGDSRNDEVELCLPTPIQDSA